MRTLIGFFAASLLISTAAFAAEAEGTIQAIDTERLTITLDDGTVGIVPEEWLRRWAGIAGMGEVSGDHVRFKMSQVALLDAALASQPAIRVDERFARTREQLASFSGVGPLDAAPSFAGHLRDYQRTPQIQTPASNLVNLVKRLSCQRRRLTGFT